METRKLVGLIVYSLLCCSELDVGCRLTLVVSVTECGGVVLAEWTMAGSSCVYKHSVAPYNTEPGH